jgi:NADH-quinone oxidoreductase subunit M
MNEHLLSIVLLTPLAGFAVLMFCRREEEPHPHLGQHRGLGRFAVSLLLLARFDKNAAGFQMVEKVDWIPSLGVKYFLGIDGISLLLVMLTTLSDTCDSGQLEFHPGTRQGILRHVPAPAGGMIGVFLSLDFFLFYVFWKWCWCRCTSSSACGRARKLYAAIKFFLYHWLAACDAARYLTLYFQHFKQFGFYTFDISALMQLDMPLHLEQWVFWAFFLASPLKFDVPFHTWLPDAHVEAPTAGAWSWPACS